MEEVNTLGGMHKYMLHNSRDSQSLHKLGTSFLSVILNIKSGKWKVKS